MADQLRGQPGVHIDQPGGPGGRSSIYLRGGEENYTVVLLGCADGDGNIFVVDEHAERLWLPQRHAAAIKAMLARHGVGLGGVAPHPPLRGGLSPTSGGEAIGVAALRPVPPERSAALPDRGDLMRADD